ncbi:hypothetical protein EDC04DRAFT_2902185 [Pisolithus marmoratus]|nr:hypothetical protein EDC04DRAFT_2902185 [Pisolithus marmoratus]
MSSTSNLRITFIGIGVFVVCIVAQWLLGPRARSMRRSPLPSYNNPIEMPDLRPTEPTYPLPAYSPDSPIPPPPYSRHELELQTEQASLGDSSASSSLHNS